MSTLYIVNKKDVDPEGPFMKKVLEEFNITLDDIEFISQTSTPVDFKPGDVVVNKYRSSTTGAATLPNGVGHYYMDNNGKLVRSGGMNLSNEDINRDGFHPIEKWLEKKMEQDAKKEEPSSEIKENGEPESPYKNLNNVIDAYYNRHKS